MSAKAGRRGCAVPQPLREPFKVAPPQPPSPSLLLSQVPMKLRLRVQTNVAESNLEQPRVYRAPLQQQCVPKEKLRQGGCDECGQDECTHRRCRCGRRGCTAQHEVAPPSYAPADIPKPLPNTKTGQQAAAIPFANPAAYLDTGLPPLTIRGNDGGFVSPIPQGIVGLDGR